MQFHVINRINGEINLGICLSFIRNFSLFNKMQKWISCLVSISFFRHMRITFYFYV